MTKETNEGFDVVLLGVDLDAIDMGALEEFGHPGALLLGVIGEDLPGVAAACVEEHRLAGFRIGQVNQPNGGQFLLAPVLQVDSCACSRRGVCSSTQS